MKLTKCPVCGTKKLRFIRAAFKANLPGGSLTIPSVPRQRCARCVEEFFDREANRILDQYLKPKLIAA